MTKTINCAECNLEYTYEPAKGYPDKRKYCANCSEKKQASWEEKNLPVTNEPIAETVPMNPPAEKATNGYKLTEENIRIGALTCALEYFSPQKNFNEEIFWDKVAEFEEYIRNGK